jgi:hypothetical protein
VFGGLAGTLTDAGIGGEGRVRVASTTAWTRVGLTGTGDLVVTPYGRLTLNQTASIQRAVVTNNGVITWGPGAAASFAGSVTSNGVLDVGTGTATIARALLLGSASTVKIRSTSATEFGRLVLGGSAQLAGALVVDFSWAPSVGVTFDFLSFRFRSGTFATTVSDTLPAGRGVRFSISGLNGRVTVVSA